jgi:hypothetical protein
LYVAAGHNGLRMTSADGVKWENVQTGREGETFTSIAFGNGVCLAAGRFGGANLFSVTRDGITWNRYEKDARYAKYLLGMVFAKGRFIALGGEPGAVGASQPFVMTSTDGENWTDMQSISGKNVLRRLVLGGERFVAVGDRGRRAVSPDGLTWDEVPGTRAVDTLVDVAYGKGVFVGVGLHGLRMSSRDGITWDGRFPGEEGEHLNSVLWTGSRFVAIGEGATHFSPDGTTWERRPNKNAPLSAVFGHEIYLGAAWKGRILRSPDAINWELSLKAEHHIEAIGFGPDRA